MKQHKMFNILLIFSFLLFIWFPFLQMKFHMLNQLSDTEKRNLQKPPKFNSDLNQFVKDYEGYFNDNFGFRTNFVFLNNLIMVKVFHYSPVPFVVIGKDGWLYHASGLTDLAKRPPYTHSQLAQIKHFETSEITFLQKNGIYFLSVIAPNKHAIYPEYLPSSIAGPVDSVRLSQREAALHQITNEEIDVRPALLQAKKQHVLYYRTDQHWNNYGSFVAYQETMKNLTAKFPQLQPLTLSDFTIVEKNVPVGGDLAYSLGMSNEFSDTTVSFTLKPESKLRKLKDENKLNTAIIYYDSFFDPVNPWSTGNFLASHFRHVIYIRGNQGFTMDYAYILKQKPDVVIYEQVERYLEDDTWDASLNFVKH